MVMVMVVMEEVIKRVVLVVLPKEAPSTAAARTIFATIGRAAATAAVFVKRTVGTTVVRRLNALLRWDGPLNTTY